MPWITLTEADVQTKLAGPELSALKTAALAEGQGNPLPEILSDVINEVRGYVATSGKFPLAIGETIPDKLASAALSIIRYRLCTRLPVRSLLTQERVSENEAAIHLLERVADARFAVDEPSVGDVSPEVIGAPKPSIHRPHRHFRRRDQDGY